MSPARDLADIPTARTPEPEPEERGLSRFPEDRTSSGVRETEIDMRKGMLTIEQARAVGKKVKTWMEYVVKHDEYTTENMHRLGRELFDWMNETTGKKEFPRHEQWDNMLWNEAKKLGLSKEQRNKIMRMTGKGWKKRMLAAAATRKIKKANDERERER